MDFLSLRAGRSTLRSLQAVLHRTKTLSGIRIACLSSLPPSKPDQPEQSQGSPDEREPIRDKQGRIIKYGPMGSVEFSASKSAQFSEMWAQPGYRDRMIAIIKQSRWPPEQYDLLRAAHANKRIFKRDDSDPRAREMGDAMVSDANNFVANLNSSHLSRYYRNAFAILHLDASQFDAKLSLGQGRRTIQTRRRMTESQVTKLREEFYRSASKSGGPFSSREERDEVRNALGIDHALFKAWIMREVRMWLRSAAVLELKGVKVDYANIPHLAWLA